MAARTLADPPRAVQCPASACYRTVTSGGRGLSKGPCVASEAKTGTIERPLRRFGSKDRAYRMTPRRFGSKDRDYRKAPALLRKQRQGLSKGPCVASEAKPSHLNDPCVASEAKPGHLNVPCAHPISGRRRLFGRGSGLGLRLGRVRHCQRRLCRRWSSTDTSRPAAASDR